MSPRFRSPCRYVSESSALFWISTLHHGHLASATIIKIRLPNDFVSIVCLVFIWNKSAFALYYVYRYWSLFLALLFVWSVSHV